VKKIIALPLHYLLYTIYRSVYYNVLFLLQSLGGSLISLYIMSSNPETESENITLAYNVLGTIGTVLWCIQLLPQIWSNWRRKDTEGLPQLMLLLWGVCMCPLSLICVEGEEGSVGSWTLVG
jgi:hypothetical protein